MFPIFLFQKNNKMDSDKPYNPRIAMACTGSALAERVKLRSRGSPQDLLDQKENVVNKNTVK